MFTDLLDLIICLGDSDLLKSEFLEGFTLNLGFLAGLGLLVIKDAVFWKIFSLWLCLPRDPLLFLSEYDCIEILSEMFLIKTASFKLPQDFIERSPFWLAFSISRPCTSLGVFGSFLKSYSILSYWKLSESTRSRCIYDVGYFLIEFLSNWVIPSFVYSVKAPSS